MRPPKFAPRAALRIVGKARGKNWRTTPTLLLVFNKLCRNSDSAARIIYKSAYEPESTAKPTKKPNDYKKRVRFQKQTIINSLLPRLRGGPASPYFSNEQLKKAPLLSFYTRIECLSLLPANSNFLYQIYKSFHAQSQ